MSRSFRANFARKIVRADYYLDDKLLGGVSPKSHRGRGARLYLEEDQPRRSKYIAGRFFSLVLNGFAALNFLALGVGFVAYTFAPDGAGDSLVLSLFLTTAILLLGWTFFWFALRAQSWLRWMVRNWNTATLASRSGITQEKRGRRKRGRRKNSSPPRREVPEVGASDLFAIARVWFANEFVRKHIKADYRPGDSLIVGHHAASVPFIIRWYPEEYIFSGKLGRAFMIATTLLPLGLGLSFFYVSRPANIDTEYPPTLMDHYLMAIILFFAGWLILGTQSFLRWMFLNWNTSKDTELSRDRPTR